MAVAACALLALAAGGCGKSKPHGLELKVERKPLRLFVVRDGETVVAQDAGARLRYQLASTGEQHRLTDAEPERDGVYRVATDEPGRTATLRVARTAHGFRVSVEIVPDTNVLQVYDAFSTGPAEHFLGGGERGAAVDLRGQILPVAVSHRCSYAPVPFLASSAGWGLRLRTQNVAGLAFPGSTGGGGCTYSPREPCTFPPLESRLEVCAKGARLDEDIYVGPIPQVLRAYLDDTGAPRVPPPAALGLVKWRDEVTGPQDVLEDIDRFRAARIPIGSVLVDNPWETCVGSLRFDPARIPDPRGLVDAVHRRGVGFLLWISPNVRCPGEYAPTSCSGRRSGASST